MDANVPRADPALFSLLAVKWWRCVTHFPFRFILMDGFFDNVRSGLAINDRIDIFAAGEGGTHAVLIVDAIGLEHGNLVKVSVLQELKR